MKSMKLGARIGLGFGVLILLALALGSVAVWNINAVKATAGKLANGYLPQVKLTSDLERKFVQAMLGVTIYVNTQDAKFLGLAKNALAEVRKGLKDGEELAARSPDSAHFRGEMEKTGKMIDQFERQLNEATVKSYDLVRNYGQLKETNKFFMANASHFLSDELNELKTEMNNGNETGTMLEHLTKVSLLNGLLELGNQIYLSVSAAEAEHDLNAIDEVKKAFEGIDKRLDALKAICHSAADLGSVERLRTAYGLYRDALTELVNVWSAVEGLNKQRSVTGREVMLLTQGAHDAGLDNTRRASDQMVKKVSFSTMIMISGILLAIIIGSSIAFFLTRAITKPIRQVVRGLLEGAEKVASASSQVASSSLSLVDGASQQAAALEASTTSLDQIGSITRQNADNAFQANQLTDETSNLIVIASQSMNQLLSSMKEITEASEDTQKIIRTIDEVAFQTNLLALNAAVEAARAGEAGAGFAVVADEVRNLAMRTAEAAQSTADLIDNTTKQVKEGYEMVVRTNSEFAEVARSVTSCRGLFGEITAASRDQTRGIDQVSTAVVKMNKIVKENAVSAEQSASASEEMNAQAEQMKWFVAELVALVGADDTEEDNRGAAPGGQTRAQAVQDAATFHKLRPRLGDGNGEAYGKAGDKFGIEGYNRQEWILPFDDGR